MDEAEILADLWKRYPAMIADLQERFGRCSNGERLYGIRFGDGPQAIPRPDGVLIVLGQSAKTWIETALFEFSHECVHVLDPSVRGEAPVFEEGIARLYQVEVSRRFFPRWVEGWPKPGPIDRQYIQAGELAMPIYDNPAPICQLRESCKKFATITPDELSGAYPDLAHAAELCEKFQEWRQGVN